MLGDGSGGLLRKEAMPWIEGIGTPSCLLVAGSFGDRETEATGGNETGWVGSSGMWKGRLGVWGEDFGMWEEKQDRYCRGSFYLEGRE